MALEIGGALLTNFLKAKLLRCITPTTYLSFSESKNCLFFKNMNIPGHRPYNYTGV